MKQVIKIGETAKQIDTLIKSNGHRYYRNFGDYMGTTTTWNDKRGCWNKVDAAFVARRYSQILELVQETKAKVSVENDLLIISYGTGKASIKVDEIVKSILLPEISKITTVN